MTGFVRLANFLIAAALIGGGMSSVTFGFWWLQYKVLKPATCECKTVSGFGGTGRIDYTASEEYYP